ncbi:gliding motility-associated C-terminal domain-containing protein [Marivirga sericea]|uniref:Gliding motility-associated C-terminal domain-containing protein n=1 Tax=Marivirga sericea TaxID=1028 RepID=A0A1X7I2C1_9BACT|nr:gliding motility-associated C-terminal domain-containing protein [Marivirga sericea]SMG08493.1 gliding motility-associated C-terminal domain-containing protein [Marivirga sericea]
MKNFIIIIGLVLLGFNTAFAAQDPDKKPTKFRIVAINASDDSIVSASNIITLFQPFSLELPTAFTPNGDGLNDEFGAVAEGVKEYRLVIYNRFGDIVFTSTDINMKWDGTVQNESAPSGGYVYQVYAKGHEGHGVDKSGKVMLIK